MIYIYSAYNCLNEYIHIYTYIYNAWPKCKSARCAQKAAFLPWLLETHQYLSPSCHGSGPRKNRPEPVPRSFVRPQAGCCCLNWWEGLKFMMCFQTNDAVNWLVVDPSEKYESQSGLLFPTYGKKCSKPPTSKVYRKAKNRRVESNIVKQYAFEQIQICFPKKTGKSFNIWNMHKKMYIICMGQKIRPSRSVRDVIFNTRCFIFEQGTLLQSLSQIYVAWLLSKASQEHQSANHKYSAHQKKN